MGASREETEARPFLDHVRAGRKPRNSQASRAGNGATEYRLRRHLPGLGVAGHHLRPRDLERRRGRPGRHTPARDADTQAAIAGSIAAALWGVPEDLFAEATRRLDRFLFDGLERWLAWLGEGQSGLWQQQAGKEGKKRSPARSFARTPARPQGTEALRARQERELEKERC